MAIAAVQPVARQRIKKGKEGGGAMGRRLGTLAGAVVGGVAGGGMGGASLGASLGGTLGGELGNAVNPAQAGSSEQSPASGVAPIRTSDTTFQLKQSLDALSQLPKPQIQKYGQPLAIAYMQSIAKDNA